MWVGQGTLFCNPEGKLYFRSQAEWALGRITVRLGIEGVTPHTFRHTVLTELQELGEPTYAAQDLAGHASDRITRRVYSHATDATRRRVAEVLDRHLGGRDVELPSRWLTIDGDA